MKLDSNLNPTSAADFLCTIEGLPETYFTNFSGITKTFTRPEYADGLTARKRKAQTGSSMVEDMELSKPYDPDVDSALIDWITTHEDGTYFQALIRPVKRNGNIEFRGAKAFRLSNCRIMKASYPGEVNSSGGDQVSMIVIGFSCEEATYS
jgi:hypothetical protein